MVVSYLFGYCMVVVVECGVMGVDCVDLVNGYVWLFVVCVGCVVFV